MFLGVVFFLVSFVVCWASLISGFIVFIKFGTFSVFFTSNIFLFLLSRTPNRYVRSLGLEQFLYYAICRILISFKTDIFLLYCITSEELKAYGDQATQLVNLKISKMSLDRSYFPHLLEKEKNLKLKSLILIKKTVKDKINNWFLQV